MAKTGVNITLNDTQLGVKLSNEGVAMLVIPISSATDPLLTTPYMLSSYSDLENIASTVTVVSNWDDCATHNVKSFYDFAGAGSPLWILGWDCSTSQSLSGITWSTVQAAIRATKSKDVDNRPRLIGFVYPQATTVPASGGLQSDLTAASTGVFAQVETLMGNMFAESVRMCAVVDAGRISTDLSLLPDTSTYADGDIAVAITTDDPTMTANVGRVLGICASVGTATSVGNMQLGSISTVDYFVNGTTAATCTNVATEELVVVNNIAGKQYLFTRTRPCVSGVYYNDGATMNSSTKALSTIEYVRVANAVCDDADIFFTQLLNTNVPVTNDGALDGAWTSSVLASFKSQYITPRISRGDVSNISVSITADGNFVSTKTILVSISILPAPNVQQFKVTVAYVASL